MRIATVILSRDLAIAFRSGGGWFYAVFFFAVFTALSAIAFGPTLAALAIAAPAAIWLAAVLAIQFAAADLFESDFTDGSLRVFAAEHSELFPYWVSKVLLLWFTAALPLIVVAPLFLTMLGVTFNDGIGVSLVLAIGAPALIFVAVLTAALSTGLRAGGLLASILAAPFAAPVLVFGVSATKAVLATSSLISPELLILGALSLFMAAATPAFAIAALRVSLE
jgi:heme exporter protein B